MKTAAIVVTYNRKELLKENIECLLTQKPVVPAVIVVDNHSTDGTKAYIQEYIDRGEIEAEEYKELNHYLFEPYKEMGGNGTAARMIAEVEKLPIKKGA